MKGLLKRARARLRHPVFIDHLYRARCEGCGWTGPVREWEPSADDDRNDHLRASHNGRGTQS